MKIAPRDSGKSRFFEDLPETESAPFPEHSLKLRFEDLGPKDWEVHIAQGLEHEIIERESGQYPGNLREDFDRTALYIHWDIDDTKPKWRYRASFKRNLTIPGSIYTSGWHKIALEALRDLHAKAMSEPEPNEAETSSNPKSIDKDETGRLQDKDLGRESPSQDTGFGVLPHRPAILEQSLNSNGREFHPATRKKRKVHNKTMLDVKLSRGESRLQRMTIAREKKSDPSEYEHGRNYVWVSWEQTFEPSGNAKVAVSLVRQGGDEFLHEGNIVATSRSSRTPRQALMDLYKQYNKDKLIKGTWQRCLERWSTSRLGLSLPWDSDMRIRLLGACN